jgi:hypothetical protein
MLSRGAARKIGSCLTELVTDQIQTGSEYRTKERSTMFSDLDNTFATFKINSDRAMKQAVRYDQLLGGSEPIQSAAPQNPVKAVLKLWSQRDRAVSPIRSLLRTVRAPLTPALRRDG